VGRRANHEGSVYQRNDGLWVASIQVLGKRLYRYGKTRSEATQKLQAVLREHHTGTLAQPSRVTLAEWVEQWLTESSLRPATEDTYRRVLRRVTCEIGEVRLSKLSALLLSLTLSKLGQQGMGPRRVQMAYTYLRTCLQRAVDLELLSQNPMARVKRPVWSPQERRQWTLDEARQFLTTCQQSSLRFAPLFAVLVACGLRISEALALTTEDIDLDNRVLRVGRALVWHGENFTIGATKTRSSRRDVSLPEPAVSALRQVLRDSKTGAYLFRTATGNPPSPGQLRRPLLSLCDSAGVPRSHVHGLRHVSAALSYAATRDAFAVQRRLGHTNVTTTMKLYAYLMTTDTTTAAALDALLGTSNGNNDSKSTEDDTAQD
jgi:integrase